jgi:hypothetical protein
MKLKLLNHLGLTLAACLFASLSAAAQETPAAPAAGRLVVQVEYLKGAKPAFQLVPRSSWFGHFATVATPQPRAAADTVLAVDVKTRLGEDGRVEIRVGVHVGERHFDRLEVVGTYHAAAGETVTAGDLERVGVAPFVFSVMRVNDADAAPPSVVNRTQSIEAVVTEFTPTPLPRGKLTLRNLSSKPVRAVFIRQLVAGRSRLQGYVMGREGKTIMEPGGSAEKIFGTATGEPSASGFTPAAIDSLVVASVVFDDYTYEGEAEAAALKRAFSEGERAQLPPLMALVREAHAAPDVGSPAAPRRLREKVSALADAAPQWAVDAVLKGHSGLEPSQPGRWKSAVEIAMHSTRRELLDELERFEKKFQASPAENSFKLWLKQRQASFEAWLSRL